MAKTVAQLEREYARYIEQTKREAERKRKLLRKLPAARYAVATRHVTTGVGGKAIWGGVRVWKKHADIKLNLKDAVNYAVSYMNFKHVGTVVYVKREGMRGAVPVFQAKWGHDHLPFTQWNGPVGEFWRRQLKK